MNCSIHGSTEIILLTNFTIGVEMKVFSRGIILLSSITIIGCGSLTDLFEDSGTPCGTPNYFNGTPGAEMGVNDFGIDPQNPQDGSDIAQSFLLTKDTTISYFDLSLKPRGNPNENRILTVSIQGDAENNPDGVDIITSAISVKVVTDANNLQTLFRTFRFVFIPINLKAKDNDGKLNRYWIRLSSNLAPSSINVIEWEGTDQNLNLSGQAKHFDGVNRWSIDQIDENRDLKFKFVCQ